MTEEEHMQCGKFTIDRVNKRVPVIAGTGSNCTHTAIDMSKEASSMEQTVCFWLLHYNKATQNGLTDICGCGSKRSDSTDHYIQCCQQNRL